MAHFAQPPQPPPAPSEVFRREVAEVDLLLDFISGTPERNVAELDGRIRKAASEQSLCHADILKWFAFIKYQVHDNTPPTPDDAAFIIALKDSLNTISHPAKGSTIAYTALYSEKTSDPGYRTASFVFPQLVASAARFRAWNLGYLIFASVLTLFAASALWVMTHGAQLAANFEESKKKEGQQASNIYGLLDRTKDVPPSDMLRAHDLKRFCDIEPDNPLEPTKWSPKLQSTTALRMTCNEYMYSAASQCSSTSDLAVFQHNFVFKITSIFLPIRWIERECQTRSAAKVPVKAKAVGLTLSPDASGGAASGTGDTSGKGESYAVQEDMRSVIAATATMINYFLPMAFGLIGALASYIRTVQGKIAACTLSPRDQTLAPVRIILGLVAGVCVALFLTPAALATKGAEIGFFTLSSSGLAFVAGYGADAFFGAIDRLIGQVFEPAAATRPR